MSLSLIKGQGVLLEKAIAPDVKFIMVGLGWDARKRGLFGFFAPGHIDLDASCALFDAENQLLEIISFERLQNPNGSVIHNGDSRTGDDDEGDDEQILVDLPSVPIAVKTLVFAVNSSTGQQIGDVANAYFRIANGSTGQEIARCGMRVEGSHTGVILGRLRRDAKTWELEVIAEPVDGRKAVDLVPAMQGYL